MFGILHHVIDDCLFSVVVVLYDHFEMKSYNTPPAAGLRLPIVQGIAAVMMIPANLIRGKIYSFSNLSVSCFVGYSRCSSAVVVVVVLVTLGKCSRYGFPFSVCDQKRSRQKKAHTHDMERVRKRA